MKYILSVLFISLIIHSTIAQDKKAYQIFLENGKTTSYANLLKEAKNADIILFGEQHNNPICHWLQLELSKDLFYATKGKLVLGSEVFEADNQLIINEYLGGKIEEKHLKAEAKIWNNYATDYAPLVNFAKSEEIPFIATNVPRRYASLVAKRGLSALDSLTAEAKEYISPLPIQVDMELPSYQNMLKMMGGHGGGKADIFVHAQAIKDATMAHFIFENWEKGQTFLHFNGAYHSNSHEGIAWYLKQQNPDLKILVISSVEQENVNKLDKESEGLGDFILVTPTTMTKTY